MLAVFVAYLGTVCVFSSKTQKGLRTEDFLAGLQCIWTHVETECLLIIDSEGNGRCSWEHDDDEAHCSPIDYETAPSTTQNTKNDEPNQEVPGCCKGDAPETNDKCNDITTAVECQSDDIGKCHWEVGSDPDLCTFPANSTISSLDIPSRGCCYADAGAAIKWIDSCAEVLSEQECAEVTNYGRGGEQRCYWEPKMDDDNADCAMTTTMTPIGCCYGSTNDGECADYEDQSSCERKRCEWLQTDEPFDCIIAMSTTAAPSTTEEEGCCLHRGNERKNMVCKAKGSKTCERSGSCTWKSAEDPECAQGCCTSMVSEKMANRCARMSTRSGCVAMSDCVFRAEWTDCAWPTDKETTTEAPLLGAKAESVLFEHHHGAEVVQSLSSISLSGVLLSMICAIATFTALAVYRRREYIKVADVSPTNMRCESV